MPPKRTPPLHRVINHNKRAPAEESSHRRRASAARPLPLSPLASQFPGGNALGGLRRCHRRPFRTSSQTAVLVVQIPCEPSGRIELPPMTMKRRFRRDVTLDKALARVTTPGGRGRSPTFRTSVCPCWALSMIMEIDVATGDYRRRVRTNGSSPSLEVSLHRGSEPASWHEGPLPCAWLRGDIEVEDPW